MTPPSISFYRGQAPGTHAVGEGPGKPIRLGQQYLAADPPLYNAAFLESAAYWMTFDADASDFRSMGDRFEAWSCFSLDAPHLAGSPEYQIVARHVTSKEYARYDDRPAYFSHGRAFPRKEADGTQDPGAYLGLSRCFDEPWPGYSRPPAPAALCEPSEGIQPARAQGTGSGAGAPQLLAYLYHALTEKRPLVVSAPIGAFVKGSPLHAQVCFARAALPRPLKRTCQIRVFTRNPDLFLRILKADLVVLPAELAQAALSARPDAILVDSAGSSLDRSPGPPPELTAWAELVWKRTQKFPGALLGFSERIGEFLPAGAIPGERDTRLAGVVYYVVDALQSPDRAHLNELAAEYFPTVAGPGIPWSRLLAPEDWSELEPRTLEKLIFLDFEDATASPPGARELSRVAAAAARAKNLQLDAKLDAVWPATPSNAQLALLLEYRAQGLISAHAVAARTRVIPLQRILELEDARSALLVLHAELEAGLLDARKPEAPALARIARDEHALSFLLQAAGAGADLGTAWLEAFLERADADEVAARSAQVLDAAGSNNLWSAAAGIVVERLIGEQYPLPPGLDEAVVRWASATDPVRARASYLRLLELTARLCPHRLPELTQRFWCRSVLQHVQTRDERRHLLALALHSPWSVALPKSEAGLPSIMPEWEPDVADLLLNAASHRLPLEMLLRLGSLCSPREGPSFVAFSGRVDAFLEANAHAPAPIVEGLITFDLWRDWRRFSRIAMPQVFQCWLTSPLWRRDHPNRTRIPPPTIEDWTDAMDHLPNPATVVDLTPLLGAGEHRSVLRIPPFERAQLAAIGGRLGSLEALLQVSARLGPEEWGQSSAVEVGAVLLESCPHIQLEQRGWIDRLLDPLAGAAAAIGAGDVERALRLPKEYRAEIEELILASLRSYCGAGMLSAAEALLSATLEAAPPVDTNPTAAGAARPRAEEISQLSERYAIELVRGILSGQEFQGPAQAALLGVFEAFFQTCRPSRRRRDPDLADRLRRSGFKFTAHYFDQERERHERPGKADPGQSAADPYVERTYNLIWRQLQTGGQDDSCWDELCLKTRVDLRPLADEVRRRYAQVAPERQAELRDNLFRYGLPSWLGALAKRPALLGAGERGRPLPALELYLLLAPAAGCSLGRAAIDLAGIAAKFSNGADTAWWESLFIGLRQPRRLDGTCDPGDCAELAIRRIAWEVRFSAEARSAFSSAEEKTWTGVQLNGGRTSRLRLPANDGSEESMSDVVTFFGDHSPDGTRRFEMSDGESALLASVRSHVRGELFAPLNGESVAVRLERLKKQIGSDAMLLTTRIDRGRGQVIVLPHLKQAAPNRALLVSAQGAQFVDFSINNPLPLSAGQRLIVPDSAEALERLVRFHELVDSFPPDQAALLLHTLRRPSLDARIERLEQMLPAGGDGPRQSRSPARPLGGGKDIFKQRPWLVWIILALLSLTLLGFWFLMLRQDTPKPPPGSEPTQSVRQVSDQPAWAALSSLAETARSCGGEAEMIANAHFTLLKEDDGRLARHAFWGLSKLLMYASLEKPGPAELQKEGAITQTLEALKAQRDRQALIVWAACRAELRKEDRELLGVPADCAETDPDRAEKAMRDLAGHLATRKREPPKEPDTAAPPNKSETPATHTAAPKLGKNPAKTPSGKTQ